MRRLLLRHGHGQGQSGWRLDFRSLRSRSTSNQSNRPGNRKAKGSLSFSLSSSTSLTSWTSSVFARCASHCSGPTSAPGPVQSRYASVPLPEQNLFDFVWRNKHKYEDRTAMVDSPSGATLTYAAAYTRCASWAMALKSMGAEKGDVLALLLPNCSEYALAFVGSPAVGVALTTMNPVYTPTEIAKQLLLSGASWAVTTKDLYPKLREACEKAEAEKKLKGEGVLREWKKRIIIIGEKVDGLTSALDLFLSSSSCSSFQTVPTDAAKDLCVLPFSSGTTGVPKGVVLTHHNLVANVCQQTLGDKNIATVTETYDGRQESTVCVLPLYHIYAMNVTMMPMLATGGKLVFLPKFEPQGFIKAIKMYKPTLLHLAPPLVNFIATHNDLTEADLCTLHHIVVAAAPSGPELIKKFKEKAKKIVYREAWGMSETSPIVMMTPLDDEHNGSCGRLVPDSEAKIMDLNTGEALGPNQRGELCVRGAQIMKGYLNNPTATKDTLQEDGWLHTGDIALYDEEGRFFIVDRLKELIKVKGFQVPPAELEDLLRGLEGIKDVAVIGIPHDKFGEAPRAYIVARANLTEDKVHAYVEENAAAYKHLVGGIEFVDAIPKSAAGKILRKELTKMYHEKMDGKY